MSLKDVFRMRFFRNNDYIWFHGSAMDSIIMDAYLQFRGIAAKIELDGTRWEIHFDDPNMAKNLQYFLMVEYYEWNEH